MKLKYEKAAQYKIAYFIYLLISNVWMLSCKKNIEEDSKEKRKKAVLTF